MNVRGVEIEVARRVEGAVSALDLSAKQEASARAACALALADARDRGRASVALAAVGTQPVGISPAIAAKIMVQEAIRTARSDAGSLRRIQLTCADDRAYPAFAKTAEGYLRHFLEVLIWGPFVTVDAIIEVAGGIVLIKRSSPPLGHALPGGFVDYGEGLEDAVRREALEETGLELTNLHQFHTYSDPLRDPRFHTITTVFSARAGGSPRAGDDAAEVRVVRVEEIKALEFAFDHGRILSEWLARLHEL